MKFKSTKDVKKWLRNLPVVKNDLMLKIKFYRDVIKYIKKHSIIILHFECSSGGVKVSTGMMTHGKRAEYAESLQIPQFLKLNATNNRAIAA